MRSRSCTASPPTPRTSCTPLTAIRSVGEAALAQPPHGGGDREAIGSMLEEVERLTHLVDSLLALGRADRDAAVLDRRAFDLAGLVEEVAEFLRALAEEKHQRLVVDLAQWPTITADRPSVRQAVINVIHNALRYSPPHGEILVHLSVHDARAVLDVIDHGPGIAPEHRERIFEALLSHRQRPGARPRRRRFGARHRAVGGRL